MYVHTDTYMYIYTCKSLSVYLSIYLYGYLPIIYLSKTMSSHQYSYFQFIILRLFLVFFFLSLSLIMRNLAVMTDNIVLFSQNDCLQQSSYHALFLFHRLKGKEREGREELEKREGKRKGGEEKEMKGTTVLFNELGKYGPEHSLQVIRQSLPLFLNFSLTAGLVERSVIRVAAVSRIQPPFPFSVLLLPLTYFLLELLSQAPKCSQSCSPQDLLPHKCQSDPFKTQS